MIDGLTILFEERDFTIATFRNCLVWSMRGEVTHDLIRRALPPHQDLKRRYPAGFGVLTIIGDTVPISMPEDARALSTSITRDFQPHYRGLCEVIEGDGFRSSITRSIVSGIRLFARSTCPSKVFGDVKPATRWLGAQLCDADPEGYTLKLGQVAERVRRFERQS